VFYNTVLEVSEGTHVLDEGEVDVSVLVGFDLRNGKHILGVFFQFEIKGE
jgi:hypothetical protein